MAEEQTDMFTLDEGQEKAEIEHRLHEISAAEAQRKAENQQFQDEVRTQLGKPRGGARPGAGRKPNSPVAATKVMRVPEQYEAAVRALIAHLDDTTKLGRHYEPVTSEPIFIRSLHDKAQYLTFTISPLKS